MAFAAPAYAGSNFSVGYTHVTTEVKDAIEDAGGSVDGSIGALALRFGHDYSENFGFEAEAQFGVREEEIIFPGGFTADLSLNYSASVFGVGKIPIGENGSNLFARAGYHHSEVGGSSAGINSIDSDGGGLAYGIGTNIFFNENNGIRLDLTRYQFENSDVDGFGVSYVRKF